MNDRSLESLAPNVREMCMHFISACNKQNIDVVITCTYRSKTAQDALYAQGRTLPGKIVTNARGGESFHNYRVAFDFVPVKDGKARWDDVGLFTQCGIIAESVGLEWAGRWSGKFKEMAHCQYTNGQTIKDFQTTFKDGL